MVGRTAPVGVRMGHAGAIIERGQGTFAGKAAALRAAGALLAETPWEVATLAQRILERAHR